MGIIRVRGTPLDKVDSRAVFAPSPPRICRFLVLCRAPPKDFLSLVHFALDPRNTLFSLFSHTENLSLPQRNEKDEKKQTKTEKNNYNKKENKNKRRNNNRPTLSLRRLNGYCERLPARNRRRLSVVKRFRVCFR